jgi:hypothetical protein
MQPNVADRLLLCEAAANIDLRRLRTVVAPGTMILPLERPYIG